MNVVIVNGFDTYEHRVDMIHDILCGENHSVTILTSDFRHFEKTKRTEPKKGFVFFRALPYYRNMSYQRMRSHSKLSKSIFEYVEKHRESIDLLWVLVPPNSFVKNAAEFKKKCPRVKLVFDLIDLWPETMPVGFVKKLFPFTMWRNLRDKNIRNADFIVTECDLYRKRLSSMLEGMRVETLYLARPLLPYTSQVTLSDASISLCYLGSINNIIDISVVREIISAFRKNSPVTLHIIGEGEQREKLLRECQEAGAEVIFHGKVFDREEKQKIFGSCHYGLNIMKESVCVGLTMKSMDYLEFGLPIINNIHGDTWEIIESQQIGFNVENPIEISDIEYQMQMRDNARHFFEQNLSENVFRDRLLTIINHLF